MKRLFLTCLIFISPLLATPTLHDEQGNLRPCAEEFIKRFGADALNLQKGKERWQLERICDDRLEEAIPLLKELGCLDSVHAEKKHYNYAVVLGSLGLHMQLRLDFLYEEWKRGVRFDQIVLLSGKRDLEPDREKYPKGLKSEAELFLHLAKNHPLAKTAPIQLIDSDKIKREDGTWRRPDTAKTVKDWNATSPAPGSVLAVSTQPFVGYQHAVLKSLLSNEFDLETIGPETQIFPMALYLDNFAKWMLYEKL